MLNDLLSVTKSLFINNLKKYSVLKFKGNNNDNKDAC